MSIDHRPLLERKARGVVLRAGGGIALLAAAGGWLGAAVALRLTSPRRVR